MTNGLKILTLDVETTTFNTGNPFDKRNKLVMVGLKPLNDVPGCFSYCDRPITRDAIQLCLTDVDILVGFNIKFDIHWLMNIGVTFDNVKQIWDCQIAEFMLNSQNNPYPSLNEALEKYGLPLKLDVVKTEYWDKNIDTDQIPVSILQEYLEYDLTGTEEVFKRQWQQLVGTSL